MRFTKEGNQKLTNKKLINYIKCRIYNKCLLNFILFKKFSYNQIKNDRLINLLKNHVIENLGYEELYSLSINEKPKK